MPRSISRFSARSLPATVFAGVLFLAACMGDEAPTGPSTSAVPAPRFLISDAAHNGGATGFYFLPPIVARPSFSGTFDADLAGLDPVVTICLSTETNCGTGTAVAVFTTLDISVTGSQYAVLWRTRGVPLGTYRIHVVAGSVGFRKELGVADVVITTGPQAQAATTTEQIGVVSGSVMRLSFRIETETVSAVTVSPNPATMATNSSLVLTATVRNLHGAVIAGNTVTWSAAPSGIIAGFTPPSATTDANGQAVTTATAGNTPGSGTITATSGAIAGQASLTVNGSGGGGDPPGVWTTKASMPTARMGIGIADVGGIIYAVGGYNNLGSALATLEAYDPATDTWTTKAPMPTSRAFLAAAAVNGILYAVGGFHNGAGVTGTVEAYDPATDTWTTKTSMPTVRQDFGLVAIDGILYAVGGLNNAGTPFLTGVTTEAYDPATDTWTTKGSMPTPRSSPGVSTINGKLYVAGGFNNINGTLGTLEVYDPAANTWTTRASMLKLRRSFGAAAVGGILYAAGGAWVDNTTYLKTVEAYDPVSNAWTVRASMPATRGWFGAIAMGGMVYAIGGTRTEFNLGSPLATVEAYQP